MQNIIYHERLLSYVSISIYIVKEHDHVQQKMTRKIFLFSSLLCSEFCIIVAIKNSLVSIHLLPKCKCIRLGILRNHMGSLIMGFPRSMNVMIVKLYMVFLCPILK